MAEIDLGDLRNRITWQVNVGTPGPKSAGQVVPDWQDRGTYWARVESMSGPELFSARQLNATSSIKITMRNVGDVRPGHRFRFEQSPRYMYANTVYRLDEMNEFLVIEATEPKDHT